MLAEGIHGGHQPVKAGMAFDSDAQEAGLSLGNASEISLSFAHPAGDLVGQFNKKLSCGRETKGIAFPLEDLDGILFLHGPHVVRDGRLREI